MPNVNAETITSLVINYQTPDLLADAVTSFKQHYPAVPLLIVDNGSADNSPEVAEKLASGLPDTEVVRHSQNIYHGPAMHQAITESTSEFVFVLDSDTVTERSGFLELMVAEFRRNDRLYSIGATQIVDKRGFVADEGTVVVKTPAFLLRRSMYGDLPPFEHAGMPTLKNYAEAQRRGLHLHEFPIDDYVRHIGRGTCDKYGYGLGISGKMDYLLHKLGL